MELAARARSFGRWQLAAVLACVVALAGAWLHAALVAPEVAFLGPPHFAPWIAAPRAPLTDAIHASATDPPVTAFERRFTVSSAGEAGSVTLRLRALREVEVSWNGAPVSLDGRDARQWKRVFARDVSGFVAHGENVVRVVVRNLSGPPLLQLSIDGLDAPLVGDTQWQASFRARAPTAAAIADDRVPFPETLSQSSPAREIARRALPLLVFAALGAGACFLARRPEVRRFAAARGERIAIGALVLFWIALYIRATVVLPANVGFDAAGHLDYVRLVARELRLPGADEGFSMYHPPLFHALAAALLGIAEARPDGPAERALLRSFPVLAGLGTAFVARFLARRLAPDDAALRVLALLAAGLLPMNLYVSTLVSNESPHAALAGVALVVTTSALRAASTTTATLTAIGVALAAALLTKYTSLVLLPILVAALVARRRFVDDTTWPRAIAAGVLVIAVVALLAGWFYLRNVIRFGEITPTNLTARPGETYWQTPGFHQLGYFLAFGDAFVRPWQAGFRSFADSIYTTLWGDAAVSGLRSLSMRHGLWDWGFMATIWPLAAPASACAVLGALVLARRAARGNDLRDRLLCSLLVAVPLVLAATLVSVTLRLPFATVPKAFYALAATGPLAVWLAVGLQTADAWLGRRAGATGRAAFWGPMAALLGAIVMTFGTRIG